MRCQARRLLHVTFLLAAIGFQPLRAGASPITILDTLGTATPNDAFGIFGTSGQAVASTQLVGPPFTLTLPTIITEIGGFLNNCETIIGGVPMCPDPSPLFVQIRRSVDGRPEPNDVLAFFALTQDPDPFSFTFLFTQPNFLLGPGSYFALFGAQAGDAGNLLGQAPGYQADPTFLGFILEGEQPALSTTELNAAVRILGTTVPELATPVPEPGSLFLVLSGAAWLASRRGNRLRQRGRSGRHTMPKSHPPARGVSGGGGLRNGA
jgi:hypothetical protein